MSDNKTSEEEEFPCTAELASGLIAERPRRVHMDLLACYSHASTGEGKKPLANPDLGCVAGDVNKGLYPVIRNRKRKATSDLDVKDEPAMSSQKLTLSQGFVSASDMYSIVKQSSEVKISNGVARTNFQTQGSPNTGKRAKITKQIPNQGSILSFVSVQSSTISTEEQKMSSKTDFDDEHLLDKPHTTLMFSPIKKLGQDSDSTSCIYISDSSPASSPCSSQNSQPRSQTDRLIAHPVVKKLFEGQKLAQQNSKGRKSKPKQSPFVNKKEKEKIKLDASMFFEGDSLDMDKVLDSDMDDTEVTHGSSKDKTGTKSDDKYGLLGSGSYPNDETERVNYFELLPLEVLENIFCHLPLLDLCLNSNRVCQQWNNIIADEKVCLFSFYALILS